MTMTTDTEDFNGSEEPQPLHELVEEAPVTRASFLANAFMESFFDSFAEAELLDDKKFLLDFSGFDTWMIEHGLMRADIDDDDKISARGKGTVRNEVRKTINRAAAFGKSVWPPFSIVKYEQGKIYEVRLLEYYAEKLPTETTQRALTYLMNKGTHWAQISAYMHSESVQKRLRDKPEVAIRFYSAEGAVKLTFKNAADALQNLNVVINETYREARKMMAIEATSRS